jgi:hypothetical protein
MADKLSGPRRRDLLGSTAVLVVGARALAAATGSILAGCGDNLPDEQRVAAGVAAAYLGPDTTDGAVAIGSAYLGQLTPGLDRDVIDDDLSGVTGLITGSMDEPAALATLEGAVTDDFRGGATMRLSGWTLSRTELRLCALVALHHGN